MSKHELKQLRAMIRDILRMENDAEIEKNLRVALWFVQDCKEKPTGENPPTLGIAVSDSVGVDDKFGGG